MLNPRLVAMSGPLDNQIMMGDSAVSRKRRTITQDSPHVYEISDPESHNGTFVNGIQISRTPLRHDDRIRVGTSEFVFLTGEDKDAGSQSSGASQQKTGGTLMLFLDQRSGLPANPSGIGRMIAHQLFLPELPSRKLGNFRPAPDGPS